MAQSQRARIDYLESVVLKMGDQLKSIRETYDGITPKDDSRIREILGHHSMLIKLIEQRKISGDRTRKRRNDTNTSRSLDPTNGVRANVRTNAKSTLGLPDKRGRAAACCPAPRGEQECFEPADNDGTPGDPASVHTGHGGATTSEGV